MVKPAGDVEPEALLAAVRGALQVVKRKMPAQHFEHTVRLMIALASGHWRSLTAMRVRLVELNNPVDVYEINARDAVVSIDLAIRDPENVTAHTTIQTISPLSTSSA